MTTEFTPAKKEIVSEPVPLESEKTSDENRIWIGNMDTGLNEYNLLQVLKSVGKFKDLDYIYHKAGPMVGLSRGFSFVTFETKKDAEKAIKILNGKQVLSKKLIARWAHEQPIIPTKPSPATNISLNTDLAVPSMQPTSSNARLSMIESIEKKLSTMQNTESTSQPTLGLHPELQRAKKNISAAEEQRARRRNFPYNKSNARRRR
uniref:Probable RNA-binding protein 18 n=1 Tax=Ciona intestinalis TaxID=7719 RepID=H2XU50_CIOIN|nr:probable RNA-binding protein 18 [Ciona intestinalis]|eukprot:XP_002127424.1 probable RNA-binding protein 18 [Ciona intestinalis]